MKKMKVATIFSGIGSFEWALKRANVDHEIVFACDNGDVDLGDIDLDKCIKEIKALNTIEEMYEYESLLYSKIKSTNFVEKSYKANYMIKECNFHKNIRLLDASKYNGDVDILVGGSPCQSFSTMGYQRGLEDTRGTLFYEYARIVKELSPKVFIYENVQGLLRHDKGKTWETIHKVFESLGYHFQFAVLNSKDFGIPQNRNRLFVVGFKEKKHYDMFDMPKPRVLENKMQDFLIENIDEGIFDFKDIHKNGGYVDEKYFLSEKVKIHVLSEGTKNYRTIPKTDLEIARPLLATMHKMHRAGVDNYVTINGRLRRLTPRECLRLMGFDDRFKQVVSDTQMYKQAGNSIVSDIFISLIEELMKIDVMSS